MLLKRLVAAIIWISIFLTIGTGMIHNLPFDIDKDITIFITDDGRKIGIFEVLILTLGIIGTIFMYKGYVFYRDKHWRFFEGELDRDRLISNLEKKLNLLEQIELKIEESEGENWALEAYEYQINKIIEINEKRKKKSEEF